MNLAAIAANATALAMKIADSAATVWSFRYGAATRVYNAASDATAVTWQHTDTGIRALAYTAKDERDTPDATAATTKRLAVDAADLTAPAALKQNALAFDAAGQKWEITNVEPDPTGALLILSLRL